MRPPWLRRCTDLELPRKLVRRRVVLFDWRATAGSCALTEKGSYARLFDLVQAVWRSWCAALGASGVRLVGA